MNFKYIDIHGHVNFSDFDADREAVIQRAHDSDVAMITVGTDIKSSESAIELTEKNENMWATVGIHPTDVGPASTLTNGMIDWDQLEKMARHPKVVAIGECGLDYFHAEEKDIPAQKEIFERQIVLAHKVGKPLMLHIRNRKTDGNAYQEAIAILKKHKKIRADFHFFAGTMQDLKDILELGYSVSFTGVVSFTHDYNELVKHAPIENVMSETDCPFVAPTVYRGKRNEPVYVIEVVKAIARIRGENEEIIAKQLVENARNFFGL